MLAILTLATAIAVHIPAPPTPPDQECEVALREFCGRAKYENSTACRECVSKNAGTLSSHHCTAGDEAAYCEGPAPGPAECQELLEKYCGVDRGHGATCATCVRDHESELKDHCTVSAEETFCRGPPKPPAPSAECDTVLSEYCGADRRAGNRTLCAECAAKHRNETEKAHCTYTQIEEFCHPVVPPSAECERVLFTECGRERYNRTACHECETKNEAAIKHANCTEEQEIDFCEPPRPPTPPPGPSGTCLRELELLCGKEHGNRTACMHCVDENAAVLKRDNCTYKEIDYFCDITPPATTCLEVLEEDCGADRRNHALCLSCLRRHANGTARAHCTPAQLTDFCEAAPPTPPDAQCRVELEHYCGQDRRNASMCEECVRDHASVLEKAHCTETIEHEFCAPAPPAPPSAECEERLQHDCGVDKANRTACIECADRHQTADHCSYSQIEQFCHSVTPPDEECLKVLFADCGADRREGKEACIKCEEEHASAIRAAHCTDAQAQDFCDGAGPGPAPSPLDKCTPALERLCEHERDNRTACIHCVDENAAVLKHDNCTYREVDAFCHITPPATTCEEVLVRDCGVDRRNKTLCDSCIRRHANDTSRAGCTSAQEEEFCNSSPTPTPTACTRYLEATCGVNRANHTKCVECTADHRAGEKSADCTSEEVISFCEHVPPSPPAPVNKCTAALQDLCGVDTDRHACVECTVRNEAKLMEDGCTEREEIAFCNKTSSVSFFW